MSKVSVSIHYARGEEEAACEFIILQNNRIYDAVETGE